MSALRNLKEKDIEDILVKHHDFFIEKGLTLRGRQMSFQGKRADLVFIDRFDDTLIVEIKKGTIRRKHVAQILDYLGEIAIINEGRIRVMIIGSLVPANWKLALDQQGIEYREITPRDYSKFLQNNDKEFYMKLNNKSEENKETNKNISHHRANLDDQAELWNKIKEYASFNLGKDIPLLNPNVISPFVITEVSEDSIQIDKLPVKFTEELFQGSYQYLSELKTWVKIGASRVNTKPDTLEGFLKKNYFGGSMNGLSTATWIAALLVYSIADIEFNKKSRGQAIRLITRLSKNSDNSMNNSKDKWSSVLETIGTRFKEFYPNCNMSSLPSSGPNVKILTEMSYVHFEWYIKGPVNSKVFEIALHIEKRDEDLNQQILTELRPFKDEFEKYIGREVFYGPYGTSGKPRNIATKISIQKQFTNVNEELVDWAVKKMRKFYDFYQPKITKLRKY